MNKGQLRKEFKKIQGTNNIYLVDLIDYFDVKQLEGFLEYLKEYEV